ncbi:hypothetical protein EYF80_006791 [Liparis tanakae]|uniref:Uncharacterized protein n=1 Tax=Liparis tanakae TaxID=230148 RepID=A0A4Z2IZ57_9TELE|nr:hypothetical protein EYF80_006791 [Liparis tanakae]
MLQTTFSHSPKLERVLDLSIMAFLFSSERLASDRSAVTREVFGFKVNSGALDWTLFIEGSTLSLALGFTPRRLLVLLQGQVGIRGSTSVGIG